MKSFFMFKLKKSLITVALTAIKLYLSPPKITFMTMCVSICTGCCMDVPEYPFDEQYDNFAFNSLLTLQESIQAMGKVRTECNRVSHNMSLYHIPTAKPMRLEEFEQTQSQATSQVEDLNVCPDLINTTRNLIQFSDLDTICNY